MRASLMIRQLEELIEEYGDLDVVGNERSVSFIGFGAYVEPCFEVWEETEEDVEPIPLVWPEGVEE